MSSHICIIPAGMRCPCTVNTHVDTAASEHVRGPSPCRPGVGSPPRPGTHVTVHSVFAPGRRGAPCGQERGWPRGETETWQGVFGRPLEQRAHPGQASTLLGLSLLPSQTESQNTSFWKLLVETGRAWPGPALHTDSGVQLCPVSLSPLFKSWFSLETPSLCLSRLKKGFQRDREVAPGKRIPTSLGTLTLGRGYPRQPASGPGSGSSSDRSEK